MADEAAIPRCGKGSFFFPSQVSVQALLGCPYTPVCSRKHGHLCARYRSRIPSQSSVDYENTRAISMHRRLGSATLSQLVSPGEGDFSIGEIALGNTVVKKL